MDGCSTVLSHIRCFIHHNPHRPVECNGIDAYAAQQVIHIEHILETSRCRANSDK